MKKRALNQLDLQRAEWKGSAEERVRKRDESSRATYTEEGGRACRMQSGKNLPDLKPTAQKYRFLIGGLSPQFNPPREESHLCYEGINWSTSNNRGDSVSLGCGNDQIY